MVREDSYLEGTVIFIKYMHQIRLFMNDLLDGSHIITRS